MDFFLFALTDVEAIFRDTQCSVKMLARIFIVNTLTGLQQGSVSINVKMLLSV